MSDGFTTRKEDLQERREAGRIKQLRGDEPPPVPAGRRGKATPEEVKRWTTYLPAKPPGRA